MSFTRRDVLVALAAAGGAAAFGLPVIAHAGIASNRKPGRSDLAARARDWAWLQGNWDVQHRRLKERLLGSDEWQTFAGKSACWLTMGGLGTVDDNLMELPSGTYRGVGVRTFDPKSGKWAIWWVDGRNPTYIEPPVLGTFDGETGTFLGHDQLRGKPIVVRFRWRDIHSKQPTWEQAFSPDAGASWEVNWRMGFTRTAPEPTSQPRLADAPKDFDFLVGHWKVRHRRLRHRLVGSQDWDTFDGSLTNFSLLGSFGNFGDNVMHFPDGTVRGVGLRVWDPAKRDWLSWWLDGRDPHTIGTPLRGRFKGGIGTFLSEEVIDGRPIKTRVMWSQIMSRSARWEQASSADDGATWESNWISEFTRQA